MVYALQTKIPGIQEQTFDGCSLKNFVKNVWGTPLGIVTEILATPYTLNATYLCRYMENTWTASDGAVRLNLYQDIMSGLVEDLKVNLGKKFSPRHTLSTGGLLTVDYLTAVEPQSEKKQPVPHNKLTSFCVPPPKFTSAELSLVSEATRALSASSRYYITGIHINKSIIRLWYLDRSCVIRSLFFDFVNNPEELALVTYAVNQVDSNMGFDRHLVLRHSNGASAEQRIENLRGKYILFPPLFQGEPPVRFRITRDNLIHSSRHLLGRGTTVYCVKSTGYGDQPFALKMIWTKTSQTLESTRLLHLHLNIPAYASHFPQVLFQRYFPAEDLELPRAKILSSDFSDLYVDRHLAVLATPLYQHLWEAESVQEFMKFFIDCMLCHYHAYTFARLLHRDVSENNVMFYRTPAGANGVLNDWDMAALVNHQGLVPLNEDVQATGTLPFMAIELLFAQDTPHRYEHDLESFFYLLVWAALHFDLSRKKRLRTRAVAVNWQSSPTKAAQAKHAFLYGDERLGTWRDEVLPEFQVMWYKWVLPLRALRATGPFQNFHQFMDVLQMYG